MKTIKIIMIINYNNIKKDKKNIKIVLSITFKEF